jgi:hypothetical protein
MTTYRALISLVDLLILLAFFGVSTDEEKTPLVLQLSFDFLGAHQMSPCFTTHMKPSPNRFILFFTLLKIFSEWYYITGLYGDFVTGNLHTLQILTI